MNDRAALALQIRARPGRARPGKQQHRFNLLVSRATRLKGALRAWASALPELHRCAGEGERLARAHATALAALVRLLDRMHAEPGLTLRERRQLAGIVFALARDLLQQRPAPRGLAAIYRRHTGCDYADDAAREEAGRARTIQAAVEARFGLDFDGIEFECIEELEQATFAQLDERQRAADARRSASRKKSARQVEAEARRGAERIRVDKALQEVYRKLAMALHPDYARDPEERAQKTLLMQEVNVAYEAKDLLQLLELQLRCAQLERADIDTLADDRLAHYTQLLAEQVAALQAELAAVEAPWRLQLDVAPSSRLAPAAVHAQLRAQLRALADDIAQVRRDTAALRDLPALRAWLRAAREAERRDALFAFLDGG